jgi:hypothetical protein
MTVIASLAGWLPVVSMSVMRINSADGLPACALDGAPQLFDCCQKRGVAIPELDLDAFTVLYGVALVQQPLCHDEVLPHRARIARRSPPPSLRFRARQPYTMAS